MTTEAPGRGCASDRRTVTAAQVVLAGGTWGTQRLLHTMRVRGGLPQLSPRLGHLTRTNSEALGGAMTARAPEGVDLTRGVAITSSFHPDADTHVENCRYGRGSQRDGAAGHHPRARWRPGAAAAAVRSARSPADPVGFARSLSVHRWSERTVIGLVMQSLDNSSGRPAAPRPARRGPADLTAGAR